eukprot:10771000-Alexandrium_andersonii.AAC.1
MRAPPVASQFLRLSPWDLGLLLARVFEDAGGGRCKRARLRPAGAVRPRLRLWDRYASELAR